MNYVGLIRERKTCFNFRRKPAHLPEITLFLMFLVTSCLFLSLEARKTMLNHGAVERIT